MTERDRSTEARVAGRILVVDDLEGNRLLIKRLLERRGHDVLEAPDGGTALDLVATHAPEVVLLDVQMPGIDGLEVCRRLRAAPETAAIPVILVTALTEREHRLNGIRAGANDFITKPIDSADLVLRVRNALTMRRLFTEIEAQYRTLTELESLRDSLVHMIVHDLRTPLTAIQCNLELLQRDVAELGPDAADTLFSALCSSQRLNGMVSDMLDVSRLEAGKMPLELAPVDINELVTEASRNVAQGDTPIHWEGPPDPLVVRCDRRVIGRVITNLLDNAIKFTPSGSAVRLVVDTASEGRVRIAIHDRGPGIPPDARDLIFEKFGQVQGVTQVRRSSGLGLAFCKLAAETHGGQIGLESAVGQGSTFWITLPAAATPTEHSPP